MKTKHSRAPPHGAASINRKTYYTKAETKVQYDKKNINIKVMETKVKENGAAVNNNTNGKPAKGAAFVNGNPMNKEADKPKEEKPAETKPAEPTNGQVKAEQPQTEQPEQPKPAQAPQLAPVSMKPALNLESTLKLVEELHRRSIQRNKLLETINNLEAFEVDIKEDADETDGNYYQGCTLTIEDDSRRKFVTKNPTIIFAVSQMVNRMCVDKLAEIEANITIPA